MTDSLFVCLLVLGFNDMSTLVGHFVSAPREGETSNRFVCVEVLRPSQPIGIMSRVVYLPNHMFTGQA